MAELNTIEDVRFAEQWVAYVAKHHMSEEVRARALIVMATIAMLNVRHPAWRSEVLAELHKQGDLKQVDKIIPLADVDDKALFANFMFQITKG